MSELAATAPKQPLRFQTAILDVGKQCKRYGMAQCPRDTSSSNCGECLNFEAEFFRRTIENKTYMEVYGKSCSMWYKYNDYQFYFNISTTATKG